MTISGESVKYRSTSRIARLASSLEPTGAEHDHRRVDLVRGIDDPFPGRPSEISPSLGGESRPSRQLRAGMRALTRVVLVQLFEGRAGRHRRHHSDALR